MVYRKSGIEYFKCRAGEGFPVAAFLCAFLAVSSLCFLSACSHVNVPGARSANIPSPVMADERRESVNERPDSVLYLPLGSDVLVPESVNSNNLPQDIVGPFELRAETLAGALQLILADYEVPLAFETDEGLTRTVTVASLRGPLNDVVEKVCGLADLYCAYEDGLLIVKDTQTFTVTVPPVGGESTDILGSLATGLAAITGTTPITETGTRTIIFEATSRTAKLAHRYFQRIRSNTALIVFEVYMWEVALNSANATGISWENIDSFGKFNFGVTVPGGTGADFTPISIGLPTTGKVVNSTDVLEFISSYGAVKTISQPQITVLSGSEATLRAADTINYVSSLSRSVDNGEVTVSTETDSVDTGFTLTISSAWDDATIYGNIEIELQEFRRFETFGEGTDTELQLPETTERELQTQIRIRPGDSLLIAGLVRENDQFDTAGPGFNKPILPTSRDMTVSNSELVFLLRPRVIVYTPESQHEIDGRLKKRHEDVAQKQREREAHEAASIVPAAGYGEAKSFPQSTISTESLNPKL